MPSRRGTWWATGQADNPLRRPVDRSQHRAFTALVLAAVLFLPALGWVAGAGTYHYNAGVERAEQAARHQVTATLTDDAALQSDGRPYVVVTVAAATWRAPDGTPRSGEIASRPAMVAGDTQRVWVDDAGLPVSAPQSRIQTVVAVLVTVFLVLLAGGGLLAFEWSLLSRRYDRQRYAMWDAAWARMDEQNPV